MSARSVFSDRCNRCDSPGAILRATLTTRQRRHERIDRVDPTPKSGAPLVADVAISGDRIAAIGALGKATATTELDVHGLAVAPGFINMLSWAVESTTPTSARA